MLRTKTMMGTRRFYAAALAVILIVAAGGVCAADTGAFFEGNQAYSQGRYGEAIARYRAALESEGASPSLLFNLANAYQQQGNFGQAILNYERALALDPGNADIQANLRSLRKQLGLYREEAPIWVRFFESLSVNAWTLLASAAFFGVGLLFLVRGVLPFVRRRREAAHPLGFLPFKAAVALLFSVMAVSLAGVWLQLQNLDRAVVTQPDARLLISPFESAQSVAPIKEGRVVEILKDFGNFSYVREANGQTGWISKQSAEPIVPRETWGEAVAGSKRSSMTQQLATRVRS